MTFAFGGPSRYTGKTLRAAHASMNLNEMHFNAVAENLQAALKDLKVPDELIAQVMTIAGSVKSDVLNLPKEEPAAAKEETKPAPVKEEPASVKEESKAEPAKD